MKKIIVLLVLAAMAVAVKAQQIAVVSSSGSTTMCQTLADAISKAGNNSVIYLPAGGFQISDDVKITRKVTILGVTHKANSDNAEGNTIISGNLFFDSGSDNSAVMGCYISGSVYIGNDGNAVNNVLIKYCNLGSVQVKNNQCSNTKINQNYIRGGSYFSGASATIENNVMHSVAEMVGGEISYNIITSCYQYYTLQYIHNSTITRNVIMEGRSSYIHNGSNCQVSYNMLIAKEWGDDCYKLESWDGVFEKNLGVTPASVYKFIGDYAEYNSKVGLYAGGTDFSDGCLPPVPYISVKRIDEQTDASGNLNVTLRVKSVAE